MIRMSGSTWVAIAKPRRIAMPLEYWRTGRSMNSPSSLQATISGSRCRTSARSRPSSAAFSSMFWRPVKSGWNPEPSSRMAATRPWTSMRPVVGRATPATSLSSVDLPAPFSPTSARLSPGGSSKLIRPSAWKARCRGRGSRARAAAPRARGRGDRSCRARSPRRRAFATSRRSYRLGRAARKKKTARAVRPAPGEVNELLDSVRRLDRGCSWLPGRRRSRRRSSRHVVREEVEDQLGPTNGPPAPSVMLGCRQ